jgi:ribosomal protein S18 acetylase RimI-like enzyme
MLRRVSAADLPIVFSMMRSYYLEAGYGFDPVLKRAALESIVGDPRLGCVSLIETNGGVVGYVVLTLGFSLEYDGRDAFIDEIYLMPRARGGGLGRDALIETERIADTLGVRALHLEVERDNGPAQRLYRRLGYADHNRALMTKKSLSRD